MQLLIKDLNITYELNHEWIMQNCYIAGGACVSNATRQPIHDIDLYFKTKEARDFFIEKIDGGIFYISKKEDLWKSLVIYDSLLESKAINVGEECQYIGNLKISSSEEEIDNKKVVCYLFENDYKSYVIPKPLFDKQKWMFNNGYDYVLLERNHFEVDDSTFYGNKSITLKKNGLIYQFILRFYGDPKEMMEETYDFQHCKIAYDLAENKYIASEDTWKCLSRRELIYVNSYYPISSIKRLYKYAERGFKFTTDEFVKIVKDISKMNLDNKFIIEDQVIGYYEDFDYNDVFEEPKLWRG